MARRRRRSPPIEMTVSIESLTNDSRGVAHHEGKAVFVEDGFANLVATNPELLESETGDHRLPPDSGPT